MVTQPNKRKSDLPSAVAARAANKKRRGKRYTIQIGTFRTKLAARLVLADLVEVAGYAAQAMRIVELAIVALVFLVACGHGVEPQPDAPDPSCASIGCTVATPIPDACALHHVCYCEPTGVAKRCAP